MSNHEKPTLIYNAVCPTDNSNGILAVPDWKGFNLHACFFFISDLLWTICYCNSCNFCLGLVQPLNVHLNDRLLPANTFYVASNQKLDCFPLGILVSTAEAFAMSHKGCNQTYSALNILGECVKCRQMPPSMLLHLVVFIIQMPGGRVSICALPPSLLIGRRDFLKQQHYTGSRALAALH